MIGNKIPPFRFWCQKVLPTVYDDSLSYYEVLNRVTEFLNNVITQMNTLTESEEAFQQSMNDAWENYSTDLTNEWNTYRTELTAVWEQYKTYIDTYFDNLDVQEEINNKLDEMASDGSLDALLLPYFNTYKNEINAIVAIQNSAISTLESRMDTFASLTEGSTTGDAELMDARVAIDGVTFPSAGDAIRGQAENIHKLNRTENQLYFVNNNNHRLIISNGTVVATNGYVTTNKIGVKPRDVITCDNPLSEGLNACFYQADGTFIEAQAARKNYFWTPNNADYCLIGNYTSGVSSLDRFNLRLDKGIQKLTECYGNINSLINSRYASGLLRNDVTNQCCSYYLDVTGVEKLNIYNPNTSCSVYFFDNTFTELSSAAVYGIANVPYNSISVPTTAKYCIFTGITGSDVNASLKFIASSDDVIEIGTGKPYTSILRALKENITAKKFLVYSGTYDVEDEYEDVYGSSFWTNYSGYVGSFDYFLRGLNLYPSQEIEFRAGATVVFNYSGSNTSVADQFSIFNTTVDNVIEGGFIDFGNGITRYAIHDDAGGLGGKNVYRNMIFKGTSGNGPVFGGGCGVSNVYIIDNCVFKDNNGSADIMYHNALAANAYNHVIVKNCVGEKGVTFLYCGDSTVVNDWIVNNCKFNRVVVSPHPTASHEHVNINLIEYCNTITG